MLMKLILPLEDSRVTPEDASTIHKHKVKTVTDEENFVATESNIVNEEECAVEKNDNIVKDEDNIALREKNLSLIHISEPTRPY